VAVPARYVAGLYSVDENIFWWPLHKTQCCAQLLKESPCFIFRIYPNRMHDSANDSCYNCHPSWPCCINYEKYNCPYGNYHPKRSTVSKFEFILVRVCNFPYVRKELLCQLVFIMRLIEFLIQQRKILVNLVSHSYARPFRIEFVNMDNKIVNWVNMIVAEFAFWYKLFDWVEFFKQECFWKKLVSHLEMLKLRTTYGALCSGRSVILAAGPQKAVPGLNFFF